MSQRDQDTLTQRLDRLERENRRLRRVGAAGMVGLFAVVLMGQALPSRTARVVEAEQFLVKDAHGQLRAALGVGVVLMEGTDAAGLRLFDKAGVTRAQFFLRSDDVPFLQFRDDEQKVKVQLDMSPSGYPGFYLDGPSRGYGAPRPRISIGWRKDLPQLEFEDKDGKIIWKAP